MPEHTGYREPRFPSSNSRLIKGATPMASTDDANAPGWQPTVLYLLGLVFAEFALLAALRLIPTVRG